MFLCLGLILELSGLSGPRCVSFLRLGKFSETISSNNFSLLLFLLSFWDPYNENVILLDVVPRSPEGSFVFSFAPLARRAPLVCLPVFWLPHTRRWASLVCLSAQKHDCLVFCISLLKFSLCLFIILSLNAVSTFRTMTMNSYQLDCLYRFHLIIFLRFFFVLFFWLEHISLFCLTLCFYVLGESALFSGLEGADSIVGCL